MYGPCGGPLWGTCKPWEREGDIQEKRNLLFVKLRSCNVMVSKLNTHHLMPVKWLIILAGWHVRIRQCQ